MASPFIGQIQMFGFGFAPRGWAFCDGQLLPISSYSALFSLLGTTFGGDGRTTFALPDLRGRSATHVGTGPGLSTITWGQRSGAENVTLTVATMPSHNHLATASGVATAVKASSDDADGSSPAGALLGTTGEDVYSSGAADSTLNPAAAETQGTVTVQNNGGNQSFSIRNPYLGIYHSIALQGIFPSRN
jgi:microcystin-dependent protein